MNQTAESGCLKPIQTCCKQLESQSHEDIFHHYHYKREDFRNKLSERVNKGHLEKTLQKPPAGVEPASLWLSFHFLQAGIFPQRTASVHSPGGEDGGGDLEVPCNSYIHFTVTKEVLLNLTSN